jgi:flagellar biogenesis protein FliO
LVLAILTVLAAEVETVPATPSGAIDFTWLFVKMLLVLAVICIGAIVVLKFVAPRTRFMKRLTRGGFAKVLQRQVLEHGKALYLVEMGKRYFVIGTSDHGISPIAELSPDEVRELDVKGVGE